VPAPAQAAQPAAVPPPGPAGDDRALAQRCAAGDGAAWRTLLTTHDRRVLTILLRALGQGHAADLQDLRQEVWARLLANDGAALRGVRAERPGALAAFVGQVALRVALDFARSRGLRARGEAPEEAAWQVAEARPAPDDLAWAGQRRALLEAALREAAQGPREARDLLVLRAYYFDGLTPGEVAALGIGLSPKGVETVLQRARVRVEQALAVHAREARA
jgi:RNA polymerase sigma-70 factor (ECF subfamily)